MPKINEKTLEKIQSEVRGSKTLYEASTIAQGKQVFPKTASQAIKTGVTPPFEIKAENYSSLNKVLRITAYANPFIKNLKNINKPRGVSKVNETEMANIAWIKYLQRKHYIDLSKGEMVLNKSVVKSQLNPKIENDELIRCYGRLRNADLPEETINPILLPTREKIVELLIDNHHKKTFHAGVNHSLAQVRIKYWIPKGRSEVKRVLRKCNVCQKYQGGSFKMSSMSPWPSNKVIRTLSFQYTGLDYFGPLYIKCGNHADRKKVWVCLFTCVVVRAIHLEIVTDLSAEDFLLALCRFIARRGKP